MIKLYTTHCPRCEVLYKKLEQNNVEFEVCEDQDEMIKLGFKSSPILEVDGKFMNFKQAVDWINNGGIEN